MRCVLFGIAIVLALSAVSCQTWEEKHAELYETMDEIRKGQQSPAQILAETDTALNRRRESERYDGVLLGGVLDAALASGHLDAPRKERLFAEAVAVCWHGESEGSDQNNRFLAAHFLFAFEPHVGGDSTIDYEAEITEVTLGEAKISPNPPRPRQSYRHVPNARPGDTIQQFSLPEGAGGKTLSVSWRVRIFDAATKQPLAPDWIHTEKIRMPSHRAFMSGRRVRPVGDAR